MQLLQASAVARQKLPQRHQVKQIAYLIDRWPDNALPLLERELNEMRQRNISILPIVCEFNSERDLTPEQEAIAPTLEFLPDAMVIEATWKAQETLAQRLEDDRASAEERAPAAVFLRQARFALTLRNLLVENNISHVHATSARAFVCAIILQQFVDLTISATIEPSPAVPLDWIKVALRRCLGGRLSDRRLIRRRSSSFLFDKVASKKSLLQSFQEKMGIEASGYKNFWQEWSELLVRWSRERPE
jgi:hypothetical protein